MPTCSKKSPKGLSLIETIVAILAGSVAFGALTAFILSSLREVNRSSQKANVVSLQFSLANTFKNSNSCTLNLATLNLGATPIYNVTTLKDFDDLGAVVSTIIPALNVEIYPASGIKATSIQAKGPGASGNPVYFSTVSGQKKYLSDLVVALANIDGMPVRPIIVPSVLITTDLAGNFVSCQTEQLASSAATCGTLGLLWDNVNRVCVPKPDRSCAAMGGVYNLVSLKCEVTPKTNLTCVAGEAINRIDNGVPKCENIPAGIWDDYGGCSASCGAGTMTRACLAGTCSGGTTAPCSYFTSPYMSCDFTLVDKIGDPPGTCGGGGGGIYLCSTNVCPAAGTRSWWAPTCDMMYLGTGSGPN